MTDRDEWIAGFARALGAEPPSAEEIEAVLGLAGVAAHGSERSAAPLACWLAARAGLDPDRALELAKAQAGGEHAPKSE
ncbi:MAG: DUF6457 domain-containing protein [Acidimicrobiales bacterium]